jgi:hypothetical protein
LFRNKTVAEVDWSGKVVWQWGAEAPGGAARQHHDWHRLPNGNTLPAVELGVNSGSRVLEIDPVTKQIVWEYAGEDSDRHFAKSPVGGVRQPQVTSSWTYRAQPVPYEWVPAGTPRSEIAVVPPDITTFRIPAGKSAATLTRAD